MPKTYYLIILMLLSLMSFTTLHKFYISVTQIEYDSKEKSFQIISRVFSDDMQALMQKRYDASIRLEPKEDQKSIDSLLHIYIRNNFNIKVNGKDKNVAFLGKEYEDDLVILYLEVENVKGVKEIQISNKMLIDLFEEQQNIIHVKKNGKRQSLVLERGKEIGVLKFSE